jgi:hypothetical protein
MMNFAEGNMSFYAQQDETEAQLLKHTIAFTMGQQYDKSMLDGFFLALRTQRSILGTVYKECQNRFQQVRFYVNSQIDSKYERIGVSEIHG